MYRTARTDVRPPAMALRPRIKPESRLIRATPTRAAIERKGDLVAADSAEVQVVRQRRVRAVTSPMPGTDFTSASASRHAGDCLMALPMSWSTASSSF